MQHNYPWEAHGGDPTAIGWTVFVLYFAAALACARRFVRESRGKNANESRVWVALCLVCVLLGLNKQLDLQTSFILFGKEWVRSLGLYSLKRPIQIVFLLTFSAFCIVGGGVALSWVRRASRSAWLAVSGLGVVALFVISRASVALDILTLHERGTTVQALVEVVGVVVIILAAFVPKEGLPRSSA